MIPTYEKDIICTYAKKQWYYKKINTGTYEKKKKKKGIMILLITI